MKKYVTSTLCSAVIVPGMGQLINGQVKKGLIHMGIIFVLLFVFVFKMIKIIMEILPQLDLEKVNIMTIQGKINYMDYSLLRIIAFAFILFWVYSIIDAFLIGLKIEKEKNR